MLSDRLSAYPGVVAVAERTSTTGPRCVVGVRRLPRDRGRGPDALARPVSPGQRSPLPLTGVVAAHPRGPGCARPGGDNPRHRRGLDGVLAGGLDVLTWEVAEPCAT